MKRATMLSAAVLIAWGGTAAAQTKPKYTRNTSVKVEVKLNDRTRPLVETKDTKQAAPELSADDILEVEGAVGEIREDQIQLLQALIDETPDSDVDEKADLYFRLAEAHAQQQRYWRLRTQEFSIKSDSAKKDSDRKDLKKKSEDAAKKAKKALLAAVDAYKSLATNDKFKNYSNMDKALFFFGYMLQSGRYMKEARSVYQRLIKEYPDSPYIPDAKVSFGDYYFEMAGAEPDNFKDHLENAAEEYKAVLQFPKSNVYTYAMYKMGWVYLNLGKNNEAFEVFFKVADLTKNDKKKEALNSASKKDLVRAYAEMGKADMAYKTFQRVDKKYAFDMLQILGDIYLDQGKAEKSVYVFRELMATDLKNLKDGKVKKQHKNTCLWEYNVAHAMMTSGTNKQKVDEIEDLVKLYGALRDKKVLPAEEAEECHDNAAAMAGDMARAYHNESIKTLNPETLAYADKLYHVYLDIFPDAEDYGETEYYYAELLWSRAENEKNQRMQTELWENAAVQFTSVVKHGKVNDKLKKESAYAAVLGWKNALAVDPRVKAPPPDLDPKGGKIPEPQPIPEREAKMLDAFDIYIDYIKDPKDKELVGMMFLKANIYRRYNHYEEAIPIFEDIYKNHKEHETAEFSVNLILDSLNKTQRFDELLKWVDLLLADTKFLARVDEGKDDDEKLQRTLEIIKQQSLRKMAESLEKTAKETGDFAKYVACGQMYIEIFNRSPDAPGNQEVLYNAGVCFEEGKSIGAAIQMFELLSANYPNDKVVTPKAIARLGQNYARIAWYKESSEKLEFYAKKYAGEKDAYDAMNDAVFYRKGIGDDDKAISDTNDFIKLFGGKKGKADDAAAAYFSLTSVYEKQGNKDAVILHLRKYISKYGKTGGSERLITAYGKIGVIMWERSCGKSSVNGSCVKVTRERAIRTTGKKKGKKRKGSDQPKQCGPEAKIKLSVVTRDDKDLKEAMKAFKSVIAEYEKKGGKTGGEEKLSKYWYAQAKFYQADIDYELFLSYKFPSNLDFNPGNPGKAKKSLKRFEEWFASKAKTAKVAREKYEKIIALSDPQSAIAAAARIGQIQQNFSDALFTAQIPEDVRTGPYADEAVEAYCDTLTTKAEPLEAKSLEAFGFCLEVSTKLGWFSSWSKLCEHELGQIMPDQFPTASELRAEPDLVAPVTAVEPAILKLP
jgi:tetratricopeptide (TPR) repeat protein